MDDSNHFTVWKQTTNISLQICSSVPSPHSRDGKTGKGKGWREKNGMKETKQSQWMNECQPCWTWHVRNASYVLLPSDSLSSTSLGSPPFTYFMSFLFAPSSGSSQLFLTFSQIVWVLVWHRNGYSTSNTSTRKACNNPSSQNRCSGSIWKRFFGNSISDTWLKYISRSMCSSCRTSVAL